MPPEACSNFGRRLVRIAPARAGQVPKIDERAVLLVGNRGSASVGARAGGSVAAKSGPGRGDPSAPSVPRSARPFAGGAIFHADFGGVSDFWKSFVFIFGVPKRNFRSAPPRRHVFPLVWRMASKLEGFLEEVMRRNSDQALHEPLGKCLKAYASRPSCAGAPPY